MSELTKEYFDKRLDGMQTAIDQRLDDVEKEINDLAMMTANGFSNLEKRLDVKDRIDKLERKMATVETALNIRL